MLIEFSVGNFKSFKDIQTFSMVAANLVSKYKEVDENNVFPLNNKISLLKSKAIYGANASGKSNLVKAVYVMTAIIRKSFEKETLISELFEEFQLSIENKNQPIFFQIIFSLAGIQYRYGFEISKDLVVSEWLFTTPNKTELQLFTREKDHIILSNKHFKEGKGLETRTRPNALFLTVVKAFNGKIAENLFSYFRIGIGILSGIDDSSMRSTSLELIDDDTVKSQMKNLLQVADFDISAFRKMSPDEKSLPTSLTDDIRTKLIERGSFIATQRKVYDETGNQVDIIFFDLDRDESQGTIKMFYLGSLILQGLLDGKTIFIDEFDARLHPLLTRQLVALFNSSKTNLRNAQLIFVTHDPTLLNAKFLRRDQICLVEKDKFGATSLHSLAEYKGVRNDASFEKDYLKGKYGAVPFLGDFESIFETAD